MTQSDGNGLIKRVQNIKSQKNNKNDNVHDISSI